MPESPEESEKRRLRELEGKNVQYYSVLLSAWIQTRMERDKTLVALSAAGIGLLVTILTAAGLQSLWMVGLYVGAFGGFLTTIWAAIRIYQLNSEKLEHELRGPEAPNYAQINLQPYDRLSVRGFLAGALFAVAIGITSATLSYLDRGDSQVPTEDKRQPDTGGKRSLEGIESLRPPAPQPTEPAAPPAPSSEPSAAPATAPEPSTED